MVDKSTGEIIPSYVSIDRQTNDITSIPVSRIKWKDTIGNTKLSQPEMDLLKTGAPLIDKEILLSNGRKFKATLQVNVEQRGIEFVPKGKASGNPWTATDNSREKSVIPKRNRRQPKRSWNETRRTG